LETTRKRAPDLGFTCSLDGEVAHGKGIPIGVFRGADIGRSDGTTASGGGLRRGRQWRRRRARALGFRGREAAAAACG
jgi:hypothetical protein